MYKNLAAMARGRLFFHRLSRAARQGPEPLKVGFLYVTPITDAGWVHQHELGRLAVQKRLRRSGARPAMSRTSPKGRMRSA